jgi:hypothetical protein
MAIITRIHFRLAVCSFRYLWIPALPSSRDEVIPLAMRLSLYSISPMVQMIISERRAGRSCSRAGDKFLIANRKRISSGEIAHRLSPMPSREMMMIHPRLPYRAISDNGARLQLRQ